MAGVGRVADSVSCGDHAATGSVNVFANGLPIVHQGAKTTTGHGCFPPTVFVSGWSSTVFVNNNVVALQGKTKIVPHKCGRSIHGGTLVTGSPDVLIES